MWPINFLTDETSPYPSTMEMTDKSYVIIVARKFLLIMMNENSPITMGLIL